MYKTVMRDSAFMAVVPLLTMLTVTNFHGNLSAGLIACVVGVLIQIPVIHMCKKNVRRIFQPPVAALKLLGVKRVSCAYEPGRYKTDFRVTGFLLWLSIAAPFAMCLALLLKKTYTVPVLNYASYQGPHMVLILISLMCLFIGMMMFPLWVKFGQAMVIMNEGNDGKRYLYRGFAEYIEESGQYSMYEKLIKEALKNTK